MITTRNVCAAVGLVLVCLVASWLLIPALGTVQP